MTQLFMAPEEFELIEFFGTEPIERNVEDGYWRYDVTDRRGVMLRFSFDVHERSIQTSLLVADSVISEVSHEGAERIRIESNKLDCEFLFKGGRTKLEVHVSDRISVKWATLRTQ